ncbi:STM4504/CBY_0614 family protein [Albibacterium bauzanense]|uniref:Abortive infection Abi-like protein n=1 Tax=Albibacterium bauzanense TaxID=653929 RepID=A0A4R1LUF2_9SPHI|nr:hypothetical protein [Albibacterium bauzanense]TCK80889.1 hypothetical protein C8N28_2643 [Albibacterium bauzanense]
MDDLFSIRNKNKNLPLIYDNFPEKPKVQIFLLFGKLTYSLGEDTWEVFWTNVHSRIREAVGKNDLINGKFFPMSSFEESKVYFEKKASIEESFDILEIIMRLLKWCYENDKINIQDADIEKITKKINKILHNNDIGYEYSEGAIIRIDSKHLHKEIINKTINLTNNELFTNANEEYLSALQHLKAEKNKEALNDALKAFESTLKIIFDNFDWSYESNATSSKLLDICFQNELIPKYLATHFTGLRATLSSGIPTIRNKNGAHGQGSKAITVPNSLAIYAIYLTGTSINYLIDAFNDFPRK